MTLKDVPGYPGYYAGDDGEIYSNRQGFLRCLPKRIHKGYFRVNIRDGETPSVKHSVPVHQLVLETYVGKRPDGMQCRHLNGDSKDNRLCNLIWGTPKENVQDSVRHGTAAFLRHGEQHNGAKLSLADVREIRRLRAEGVSQYKVADAFGVSRSTVSRIDRGLTWAKDK